MKQEVMGWQQHQLDYMQIIALHSKQITMPVPHRSVFTSRIPFLAAQPTASKHCRHTLDLNRDLSVISYLLFFCYLFAVTFGMMNSMAYYFTDAVTEAFINDHSDAHNPDLSFREIDGADDWFNVSTLLHNYVFKMIVYHVNIDKWLLVFVCFTLYVV